MGKKIKVITRLIIASALFRAGEPNNSLGLEEIRFSKSFP